jgi:PAS domain S-box-containing protein
MAGGGYLDPALVGSAHWAALLDSPVACIASVGARLVFCNDAMAQLLGFLIERLVAQQPGWLNLLFPDAKNREEVMRDGARILKTGGVSRYRRAVTCGDSVHRTLDLTCAVVNMPDGQAGLMAIATDVSGLPLARDGGARSLGDFVEDAPDLMIRVDVRNGHLIYANRAIERFTGRPPDDFSRDPGLFARMIVPDHRSQWEAALRRAQLMESRTFDLELAVRMDERVVLQLSLSPVRDATGRVTMVEGVGRDETSLKQLEEMRQRSQERASLEQLKSQLLANVSHELRTPLVSIKGYNDLLLRGMLGPINARQRRGLEIAAANTQRLIELIETLLDFARHEGGRLELKASRIDVRTAVRDAAQALDERFRSRNLTLSLDLGVQPMMVMGDRQRLGQVFRALLTNAEKFTELAGVDADAQITVVGRERDGHVEVSVADRGIGIPQHAHARIFDRFYQVDASSTRRFGGAGLGLALAKELVTAHHGEILVDSAEGRGSTFTVRLPTADAVKEVAPTRAMVLVGAQQAEWQRLQPILSADALQPIDLVWASSEAELARRARRHRPDLVVLALPALDAALAELKRDADSSTLPVVAVADVNRPIGRADLVVAKADEERLVAGVQRLLGRAAPPQPQPTLRPRVVVVEDELEILDFTRFVLEREGYEVVAVSSGEAALGAVTPQVDLCILDIALEDADGIEICRQLKERKETAHVPVLVVTAMSGDAVRRTSLGAGADGYLMKPFGLDEFLRQVRLHMKPRGPVSATPTRESA